MSVGGVTTGPALTTQFYSFGSHTLKAPDGSGNYGFEIGSSTASGKTVYLDLHYGTGSTQDYNVRIINSADEKLEIVTPTAAHAVVMQVSSGHPALGIGGAPGTNAALDVQSTVGGVLLPRMTSTQRDAMTPADGMVIYNTTTSKFQGRQGGAWVDLA